MASADPTTEECAGTSKGSIVTVPTSAILKLLNLELNARSMWVQVF